MLILPKHDKHAADIVYRADYSYRDIGPDELLLGEFMEEVIRNREINLNSEFEECIRKTTTTKPYYSFNEETLMYHRPFQRIQFVTKCESVTPDSWIWNQTIHDYITYSIVVSVNGTYYSIDPDQWILTTLKPHIGSPVFITIGPEVYHLYNSTLINANETYKQD